MKRKYVAMMLGFVLTLSSLNVASVMAAAGNTDTVAEDTNAGSLNSDVTKAENAVYGKVTEVNDKGFTISVGNMTEENETGDTASEDAENADAENTGTEDANTENTDSESADTENTDVENPESDTKETEENVLQLTGDESAYTVEDDTVIQRETKQEDKIVIKEFDATAGQTDEQASDDKTGGSDTETTEDAAGTDETDKNDDAEDETKVETITLADIKVGDIVKIQTDADGKLTITVIQQADAGTEANNQETENTAASDASDKTAE